MASDCRERRVTMRIRLLLELWKGVAGRETRGMAWRTSESGGEYQ